MKIWTIRNSLMIGVCGVRSVEKTIVWRRPYSHYFGVRWVRLLFSQRWFGKIPGGITLSFLMDDDIDDDKNVIEHATDDPIVQSAN
jgi:hypothetical protein